MNLQSKYNVDLVFGNLTAEVVGTQFESLVSDLNETGELYVKYWMRFETDKY